MSQLLVYLLLGGLILVVTALVCMTTDILLLWMLFTVANFGFVCSALRSRSYMGAILYYIIQEFSSILFLFAYGSAVTGVIIMIKLAVSPLHWWMVEAASNFSRMWLVAWSMSYQKLPYMPAMALFWSPRLNYVVLFGIILVRLQILAERSAYKFFLLASTVSTGWFCLFLGQRTWSGLVCAMYYLVISYYYYRPTNRPGGADAGSILAFFNAPMSGVFLAKVYYSTAVVDGGFVYLVAMVFRALVRLAAAFHMVDYVAAKGILASKLAVMSIPICFRAALVV